jgi:hypothetical protein
LPRLRFCRVWPQGRGARAECGILGPGFPGNFGNEEQVGGIAREYKQVVAEPVEITQDQRFHEKPFILEADAVPFSAAANAAGNMGGRNGYMSAGQ